MDIILAHTLFFNIIFLTCASKSGFLLRSHSSQNNPLLQDCPEFSLALQSGQYQVKWMPCHPLPIPMWWAHAAIINSIIYIGGGECPDDLNMLNVYAYHLVEDKWTVLPPHQQYYGIPVNVTEKLTIIGGRSPVTPYKRTSKVTAFVGSSWRNEVFPNMLAERSWPAIVSYQSYIIVAGGCGDDGTILDSIEVLDTTSLQWIIVNTQLPQPMYTPSAAMCGKSLVIVGFGTVDNKRCNEMFLIDVNEIILQSQPSSSGRKDKWISLANAPYWKTALIPSSSHPVIIGGSNKQQKLVKDITLYDDVTKNWRTVSSLPVELAFPTTTIINNCIIVAGGCKNAKTMKSATASCVIKVFKGHLEEI